MKKKPAKAKRRVKRSSVDTPARKYIFWASDEYPYVHGGVGLLEDNGMARIPTQGVYVAPTKVMEVAEGEALAVVLGRLKRENEAAHIAINEGFSARLKLVASWVRPPVKKKPSQVTPYPVSQRYDRRADDRQWMELAQNG